MKSFITDSIFVVLTTVSRIPGLRAVASGTIMRINRNKSKTTVHEIEIRLTQTYVVPRLYVDRCLWRYSLLPDYRIALYGHAYNARSVVMCLSSKNNPDIAWNTMLLL